MSFDIRENAWMYAGWTLGGAAAGAVAGSFFDVDWIRTGHRNGHVTHRMEITKNSSWLTAKRFGSDTFFYRKSKTGSSSRHGFSMGFRYGNMIWFDIKLGTPVYKKPWDINFPNFGGGNHFLLFKKIPRSSAAWYDNWGPNTHDDKITYHFYFGGRWKFVECGDDTLPTKKGKTKHR